MGRFGLAGWLVVFSVSVGCGGIMSRRVPGDDGDESGGSATGGSPATVGGFASGGSAPRSVGNGNNPNSGGGVAVGTGTCVTDRGVYTRGDTFTASDGCNICSCKSNGKVECTTTDCADNCSVLEQTYTTHVTLAGNCDNDAQCSTQLPSSPWCGCPVWLNANDVADLRVAADTLKQLQQECVGGVVCSPCLALPRGRCIDRRCER